MLRAKQYGPVIEAALKAAKAPPALKGYLIGKMVEAEEMFELVMGEGIITTQVARTTDLPPDLPPPAPVATVTIPESGVTLSLVGTVRNQPNQQSIPASSVDLSERFDIPAKELTVDELYDHYAALLPGSMKATFPGFPDGIILHRRLSKATFGNAVKIQYTPPGLDPDTQSCQTTVTGSGVLPTREFLMHELQGMARMYSAQPVASVAPRLPPHVGSLSELLPGSPAAETDPEASGGDMKAWRDGNQTSAADIAYSSGRFGK